MERSLNSQIVFSPKFCYRSESIGYSIIYELCRHNYGQTNLGHGLRFRPEVLRNRCFCMMGVMECVHKLDSRMFHTAMLGENLFSF